MDYFDFGKKRMAAVLLDVGRAKLPDGTWLHEVIKRGLMSRARNEARSCLVFMPQSSSVLPRTISESTYQIDSFKQKDADYVVSEQIKSAAKALGESQEDNENHLILISRNFDESYEGVFEWMRVKDYDIRTKIIGIGKDTDLLQLVAEEYGFAFAKADTIESIKSSIERIGE